jgi:hypothetical protein
METALEFPPDRFHGKSSLEKVSEGKPFQSLVKFEKNDISHAVEMN